MKLAKLAKLEDKECTKCRIKKVGHNKEMDSLAQPDPYAGGEGLVTCCTRSCPAGMQ